MSMLRFACAVIPLASATASIAHAQTIEAPDGYTLVWNDEFDGDELDRGAWCTRLAFGGGASLQIPDAECTGPNGDLGTGDFLKDERERYRDTNARGEKLHVVNGGVLTLRATKTGYDDYAAYESAMIRSKLAFKPSATESYYVKARVRLPDVRGSFAALWLTGGFGDDGQLSWPPEIDILEAALNGTDDTSSMVHVGVQVDGRQTDSGEEEFTSLGSNFDTRWNNVHADQSLRAVWIDIDYEWTATGVCTRINGELAECENYRWVDNDGKAANAANLVFNLAVGGEWAGRYGIDNRTPMAMDIDYVRVFKK